MNKVSRKNCYLTIECLLDFYFFNVVKHRDIATLASSMMLAFDEDMSLDQAMWQDWLDITKNKQDLTMQEGYDCGLCFLDFYANLMNSKQIRKFIEYLKFEKWQKAVEEVLSKEKNHIMTPKN